MNTKLHQNQFKYLGMTYSQTGQREKAEEVVRENYQIETSQQEVAENNYEILKEIAPGYRMTKILRRKLHPGFLWRMLDRMAGQVQSKSESS